MKRFCCRQPRRSAFFFSFLSPQRFRCVGLSAECRSPKSCCLEAVRWTRCHELHVGVHVQKSDWLFISIEITGSDSTGSNECENERQIGCGDLAEVVLYRIALRNQQTRGYNLPRHHRPPPPSLPLPSLQPLHNADPMPTTTILVAGSKSRRDFLVSNGYPFPLARGATLISAIPTSHTSYPSSLHSLRQTSLPPFLSLQKPRLYTLSLSSNHSFLCYHNNTNNIHAGASCTNMQISRRHLRRMCRSKDKR